MQEKFEENKNMTCKELLLKYSVHKQIDLKEVLLKIRSCATLHK